MNVQPKNLVKEEQSKPKLNRRKEVIKSVKQKTNKSNKIYKPPIAVLVKKREKGQIINFRNEGWTVAIEPTDFKRKIKEYLKKFMPRNLVIQMEWTNFVKNTQLTKSDTDETYNLNGPVYVKEENNTTLVQTLSENKRGTFAKSIIRGQHNSNTIT